MCILEFTMQLTRSVVVSDPPGLTMLRCSKLVELISKMKGKVQLSNGVYNANCRSIIDLLLLGAAQGTELILTVDSDDAIALTEAITQFFERNPSS